MKPPLKGLKRFLRAFWGVSEDLRDFKRLTMSSWRRSSGVSERLRGFQVRFWKYQEVPQVFQMCTTEFMNIPWWFSDVQEGLRVFQEVSEGFQECFNETQGVLGIAGGFRGVLGAFHRCFRKFRECPQAHQGSSFDPPKALHYSQKLL